MKKSENYFFIAEKAVGAQLIIDFMFWLGGFRELDILYECVLFIQTSSQKSKRDNFTFDEF